MTYHWSKVSRETLARFAIANLNYDLHATAERSNEVVASRKACHAEAFVPPLRTRAEVDAELVRMMRERCALESASFAHDRDLWLRFRELCAEETAPDPNHTDVLQAPGFDGPCFETRAEARASAPEAADPDPCSCEEALGLRRSLEAAVTLLEEWVETGRRGADRSALSDRTRYWLGELRRG